MINVHKSERLWIANNLNKNISNFMDSIKGHMAIVEDEISLLESMNLSNKFDALVDHAYQAMIDLHSENKQ